MEIPYFNFVARTNIMIFLFYILNNVIFNSAFNSYKLALIGLSVVFFACQKNELKPDICEDAEQFQADFSILEAVGDSLVITDKVLLYSSVSFQAGGDYDGYEWRVGNDQNVSNKKIYTLLFSEIQSDIEVRLIATKAASPCFPIDKTVDTAFHIFSVVPWENAAILGKYVGSYGRTPQLIDTVEISYAATAENPDPFGEFNILNINQGCDVEKYPHQACPGWSRGYRAFAIKTDLCKKCPGTTGLVKLIDDNNVEANIKFGDTTRWGTFPLPQIADKFVGKRIAP